MKFSQVLDNQVVIDSLDSITSMQQSVQLSTLEYSTKHIY